MNSIIEIDIKNRTYYFFDDMMSIKNLDPNNIKIENNHRNTHRKILFSVIMDT